MTFGIYIREMLALALAFALYVEAKALPGGLGRLPVMGWNTWNAYRCEINAEIVMQNAERMANMGLKELGYTYINLDDCWSADERDAHGRLFADPLRFPQGISHMSTQLHDMGYKFGIYSSAGIKTCEGYPASLGYEQTDAQTFAAWGVDLLKYDNCYNQGVDMQTRFKTMRDALNDTGRPIVYSLCQWGYESVWTWGNRTAESWRITPDIFPTWPSIHMIACAQSRIWNYGGPYGHNDLDMLEVGNSNLSAEEEQTHFSVWALAKSPLIIGADLSSISAASLRVLSNRDLIAINQDILSIAAMPFYQNNSRRGTLPETWFGPLEGGRVVLMVLNYASHPRDLSVKFDAIPGFQHRLVSEKVQWRELWSGRQSESYTGVFAKLAPHGCAVYILEEGGDSQRGYDALLSFVRAQLKWSQEKLQLKVQ